jgi:phosphatidate cytidylyltransferase
VIQPAADEKPKMGNLAARVLTAVVLVPLLIAAIQWSNPIGVWAIVFVATMLALREYYGMTLQGEPASEQWFGVALGLAVAAVLYWLDHVPGADAAALAGATLACFLFYLFRYREIESVARRVTATLSGVLYVALLLTYVALLKKRGSDGGAWVYITLTCTWFSDTTAYFAGRFLGPFWPAKLYPAVSPKKSVMGAFGGMAGSIGALILAKLWYLPSLSWADVFLVAVPANVLAQTGDLCESLLKRSVGVKDSGNLLPGHGGMLDRIDALLFVVPYVYCYARWAYGHI